MCEEKGEMLYKCLSILMCMKICYLKILYTDLDHIKRHIFKIRPLLSVDRETMLRHQLPTDDWFLDVRVKSRSDEDKTVLWRTGTPLSFLDLLPSPAAPWVPHRLPVEHSLFV